MRPEDLDVVITPGLGDATYVLASGDEAVVIDPQRDAERFLARVEARGARLVAAIETHVHNDYVSGAVEIREATGARILGPADAGYAFAFEPLRDGDSVPVGDLRLVALATPGHTPEHTSYAVHRDEASEPLAVFTGGSLIVGSAGRTDLLGTDLAEQLARAQFRSLRRFTTMPDATLVLPTHGAGSFCATAPPQDDRTSTIGRERVANPALQAPDEDTFVHEQLTGLLAFPAYYAHMAPINRSGPPIRGGVPSPPPLSPPEVEAAIGGGARLVDARVGSDFAEAHVSGSLNVPLEDSFASYVGWLVPFGTPIVLVCDGRTERAEAAVRLFRIGYEVLGYLDGGVDAWAGSGRPTSSYPVVTLDELIGQARSRTEDILDVRQRAEWDAGHLPGSQHCFVGDLPARLPEFIGRDRLTIACASGFRSSIAASLLHAAGVRVRLVASGGVPDALPRMP